MIEVKVYDGANIEKRQEFIIQGILSKVKAGEEITLPENGLHPKYIVVLAEKLVMLAKENCSVLIEETYSSELIEALSVYSHKHGLEAEFSMNGEKVGDTTCIFDSLCKPFNDLVWGDKI